MITGKNVELLHFSGPEELARAAAREWLTMLKRATTVALSGGRISKQFLSAVVEFARKDDVDFLDVDFFWADERCVPPDDPESNYRMARELLFEPLEIPGLQIHRIHGEDNPDEAAHNASEELIKIARRKRNGVPVLDFIFLGMGEDGHVASLFPNMALPASRGPYQPVANAPKPPPGRITLTYDAIAAAEDVWVLVSGAGKELPLRDSLKGGVTPLGEVLAGRKKSRIFFDVSLESDANPALARPSGSPKNGPNI